MWLVERLILPVLIFLVVWVVTTFALYAVYPYDDTDDRENGERSGLVPYTDHATGCQYLKGGLFSGITPRLDRDGNHMCNEGEL